MASDSWGRWGADDELGALNLIGAREVLRAAGTVRRGQVVRLGQDLGPSTLVPRHRKKPERFMTRDGGDYAAGARRPDGFQFAEDVVSFATHTGTHIDALSHVWCDDLLYNGFPSAGTRSTTGARRCGAEKLAPIVTRGVLLDVAALQRRPLGPGAVISAADLRTAAEGGTHPGAWRRRARPDGLARSLRGRRRDVLRRRTRDRQHGSGVAGRGRRRRGWRRQLRRGGAAIIARYHVSRASTAPAEPRSTAHRRTGAG